MIKPLRSVHFIVWRVLALVIPIAFVLALLFRPKRQAEQKNVDNFRFTSLRQDSSFQITIQLLNPLTTPSCLVYAVNEQQKILLGKIETKRTYIFYSPARTKKILLFDGIHKEEILTYSIPNDL
jgi:hypothetical protein